MNDLDIIDAEIVEDGLAYADADAGMKSLAADAADISDRIDRFVERAASIWRGRPWDALGHKSWADCCEAYGVTLRLPRPDRRELVAMLDQEGMTTRAIAPVVSAGVATVSRDLNSGVPSGTPAEPRAKTGLDGKTYTIPARPEPPHTVNADTGEVIDKATGEVITHLPDHDAIARETNAIENVAHMADTLTRLAALRTPEYRARLIRNNAAYPDAENPFYVEHFNPQSIRHLADLLNTFANELETAS